jgi:hypothetical protein
MQTRRAEHKRIERENIIKAKKLADLKKLPMSTFHAPKIDQNPAMIALVRIFLKVFKLLVTNASLRACLPIFQMLTCYQTLRKYYIIPHRTLATKFMSAGLCFCYRRKGYAVGTKACTFVNIKT